MCRSPNKGRLGVLDEGRLAVLDVGRVMKGVAQQRRRNNLKGINTMNN